MDKAEKQQLKIRIQDELTGVNRQILDLEELTRPIAPDCAIGRVSRMEALNDKSVNEHLLAKSRLRKARLETSLAQVDSPGYGLCKKCRQPIPLGRLMMLPETDTCVDCAR